MTERIRFASLERGQIDLQTGEFPMVLATNGEASDGDILSIEGAQFSDRAPLQLSHINDPRSTMGTISGFRRDLVATPKRLLARGKIELGGDGPAAEIRRDVAFMVSEGHVSGISVRWEPIEYLRRVNLPADHYAYIDDEKEKDWRKRYGFFHKKWRVQEGSIVAVQADKEAMIGRALLTEGAVAAFWRAMADEATATSEAIELLSLPEDRRVEPEPALSPAPAPAPVSKPNPPTKEARLAALAAQLRELRDVAGIAVEEIVAEVERLVPPKEPTPAELAALVRSQAKEIEAMTQKLASLEGRVDGAPAPPQRLRSVQAMVESFDERMRKVEERALDVIRAAVDARKGKIDPDLGYRGTLHAEADLLLAELTAPRSGNGDGRQLEAFLGGIDARLDQTDELALDAVKAAAHAADLAGLLKKLESKIESAKQLPADADAGAA